MIVKKFLKGFMVAALVVTMAVMPVSSVKAAPETMPDGTIFDADYYAQTYPDVANVLGTDRDALYNHYVTFGKAEGRMACAPTTTVQEDKTPIMPSTQSKDPLTARTTPMQAIVYANFADLPEFMLTDSRPKFSTSSSYNNRTFEYVYDDYGNLINDGWTNCCICDAEGKIVMCRPYGIYDLIYNGKDYGLNCVYNEYGQIIQMVSKDENYNFKFYYDNLGRLIRITNGENVYYELHYNEQERTINCDGNISKKYIYDEQGKLVKYTTSSSLWEYIYEYDASGKLIRERSVLDGESDRITEYSYN